VLTGLRGGERGRPHPLAREYANVADISFSLYETRHGNRPLEYHAVKYFQLVYGMLSQHIVVPPPLPTMRRTESKAETESVTVSGDNGVKGGGVSGYLRVDCRTSWARPFRGNTNLTTPT